MKKLKRIVLAILLITVTLVISAGNYLNSYATTDQVGIVLGLEESRTSGYAYQALRKNIWKISQYSSLENTIPDKTKTIYCLKGGPGFGSTGDMGVGGTVKKTYNEYFDMKDSSKIDETYRNVLPTDATTYNSLLWLLDNVYVAPSGTPQEDEIEMATAYKEALFGAAGIQKVQNGTEEFYALTDDDIDVVQQLAVWFLTNSDEYKVQRANVSGDYTAAIWTKGEETGGIYRSLDDLGRLGGFRQEDAIKLLNYFIDTANANGTTYEPRVNANPIELIKTNATYERTATGVYVGPFKINELVDTDYSFSSTLKNGDNNDVDYQLAEVVSGVKTTNGNTVESYIGSNKEFYFYIADADYDGQVKFDISVDITQTDIKFWSVTGAAASEQPVAVIERESKNYTDNATLQVSLQDFDLALRKFITSVNGTALTTSRVPTISTSTLSSLNNGTITTAQKVHPKTPIQVVTGDKVIYTIRVYNEGELDGYATQITDYLPTGLEFIPAEDSTINTNNGWTNPSGDGKTIVTSKLNDTLISAFDGTTLDYEDIQIECEVVATIDDEDQTLKNIAEITAHKDENGIEILNGLDRDSNPKSLTTAQRNSYTASIQDDDDYEDLVILGQYFDLALRKFIVAVNSQELKDSSNNYTREPNISITNLQNGTSTDAVYSHVKNAVSVKTGDIVTYAIKVYNEGQLDGYAKQITDHLPQYLEFISDETSEAGQFNAGYGWVLDASDTSLRTVRTSYLSREADPDNLIEAFDARNGTMDSSDYVYIKCLVKEDVSDSTVLTNIAEITMETDENGTTIADRDSAPANVVLPVDENLPDYKGNVSNKNDLSDATYFYKGQQDDDDFEKIIITKFDLALRKFITGVNSEEVNTRIPVFTTQKDENGNYVYEHPKTPVMVETADTVIYTIRIYNEGSIGGYASEIKDNIPEGLEFLPENDINTNYNWVMLDEDGEVTNNVEDAVSVSTSYLAKNEDRNNLLQPFTASMTSPNYKDVQIAFKVIQSNTSNSVIINTAEIKEDTDEAGNAIQDDDSTPNNNVSTEDDIDIEKVQLEYFDLALRKFITAVNDEQVTTRIPVFTTQLDDNNNYIYEHPKTPVDVTNGDLVTYTIRIFNEGTKDGYASEIKDNIPKGLEFLPDNENNKNYDWKMLDGNGIETSDVKEAKTIVTKFLSKEEADNNIIESFTGETPSFKDVQVVFKVTEPNTSSRIVINTAEIKADTDSFGEEVIDRDSIPNNDKSTEDDIDIEKVKVNFFDLALKKWVTKAIVIENGKETVTETGHTGEENPEPAVKVELKKAQIKKVVVKFAYKVKVTNEGQIAGYVKELKDYIPGGLKFDKADNPLWEEVETNVITTDQLKDTLLQPGETATVDVVLTWINGADNMGEKINIAEISDDYNEKDAPDIDSVPNNAVAGEDDIDVAPVLLSVKTGSAPKFIGGFTLFFVIVGAGVILIKKYVI
ncbi:MAG: Cys-Gln thioester bond-forming surface protein [Clostridia bacterium]|nr:Cys-Gln thioester bond-forming surface protein [Clostridia bacterium]